MWQLQSHWYSLSVLGRFGAMAERTGMEALGGQRPKQRQRLHTKHPVCQGYQLTGAAQNSLAIADGAKWCAHVNLLCNIALICFIDYKLKARTSPNSGSPEGAATTRKTAQAVFSRKSGTSTSGSWRLGEFSAALSTFMLGSFAFQASLLGLFATRDTVRAWEVGGA